MAFFGCKCLIYRELWACNRVTFLVLEKGYTLGFLGDFMIFVMFLDVMCVVKLNFDWKS